MTHSVVLENSWSRSQRKYLHNWGTTGGWVVGGTLGRPQGDCASCPSPFVDLHSWPSHATPVDQSERSEGEVGEHAKEGSEKSEL
jgi:hypothetical protein